MKVTCPYTDKEHIYCLGPMRYVGTERHCLNRCRDMVDSAKHADIFVCDGCGKGFIRVYQWEEMRPEMTESYRKKLGARDD